MSTARAGRPGPPRRFSSHLRRNRLNSYQIRSYGSIAPHSGLPSTSELEQLLEEQHVDEEHADTDGLYPPNCCWTADCAAPPPRSDPFGNSEWPVYYNIHHIRHEIIESIDDPYSAEQLKAPRMNISVVRPLVEQFYATQDLSMVYCLLVNRVQFARERSFATHHQTVNLTRALLCEIIAEKLIRRYNEHNPGPKGLLKLANILVAGFEPFQGAPESVIRDNESLIEYMRHRGGKQEKRLTALEIAIISESKSLLASGACQKVIDAIYRGKLVYTPNSFIDILPDYWKKRPISLYDPRRAPMLNQYRLFVPRTRNIVETIQFIILLVLYLTVMSQRETRQTTHFTTVEAIFDIYTLGWILDQIASMLEHGWQVYTQNLWSFLDVMFSGLFLFYLACRIISKVCVTHEDRVQWARLALDALSCAAPVLIPRIAFNVMSENVVFLCLRDMLKDFMTLVLLAVWCFVGFLLSLKWLHNGIHKSTTIGKWMIWIWFGLDGTGIDRAGEFHWLLGPTMMVMFAFLGNSLFLTILVSTLTNTFSRISSNITQEMHYRRAVLTFQGVKSDAIFAYMPPTNLLAMCLLVPVKLVASPRWFHKINVFAIKVVNAPILLLISWYERNTLWLPNRFSRIQPSSVDWKHLDGNRAYGDTWFSRFMEFWDLSRFSVHGDMQAVFEDPPPLQQEQEEEVHGPKQSIGNSLRQDLFKQFDGQEQIKKGFDTGATLNAMFATSPVPVRLRAASTPLNPRASIRHEFADETDGEDSDTPAGYHKMKPRERMDSIIDYSGGNDASMMEANARLHKLEESVDKIESLLLQILQTDTDGASNPEDDSKENGTND